MKLYNRYSLLQYSCFRRISITQFLFCFFPCLFMLCFLAVLRLYMSTNANRLDGVQRWSLCVCCNYFFPYARCGCPNALGYQKLLNLRGRKQRLCTFVLINFYFGLAVFLSILRTADRRVQALHLCLCLDVLTDIFVPLDAHQWLSRYSDWLRAGRSGDRIPVGARYFAHVQTGPGAHPASCTMGTGSFSGVKQPGRGADHPPPSSAEVENE
jgi:hypothetical protein